MFSAGKRTKKWYNERSWKCIRLSELAYNQSRFRPRLYLSVINDIQKFKLTYL